MLHASETWSLMNWSLTKPNLQHLQRNDREIAMSSCKILSPSGPMSYLRGLALRIWTSYWRREDSTGMDMRNAPMVHSRQPVTHRLVESVGLEGPRWHGSSWQKGIAESGSSRLSTRDRHTQRSGERSAMRAESQLPGRGPSDVDVAPVSFWVLKSVRDSYFRFRPAIFQFSRALALL